MTWVRIDDGFWMHPKIVRVGNDSAGAFVRMLSYCGCYLTDGRVPGDVARTIAGRPATLTKLVNQGLLVLLPASGDYAIQDFADYNPLRDEVEAQRAARKAKAEKAAAARWGNR